MRDLDSLALYDALPPEEQAAVAAALRDQPALAEAFDVEALGPDRYRVVPRAADAGFREAELAFAGALPASMRIIDRLGQAITIRFLGLDESPLPGGTFEFTPPDDVDVYREDD